MAKGQNTVLGFAAAQEGTLPGPSLVLHFSKGKRFLIGKKNSGSENCKQTSDSVPIFKDFNRRPEKVFSLVSEQIPLDWEMSKGIAG